MRNDGFSMRLIAFLALGFIRWGAAAAPEPNKLPTVVVKPAKAVPLYDMLSYPARLSSKINAPIIAEIDGIVSKIEAPLGRPVKRNTRILQLRNTDPVYSYRPVSVRSPVSGVISTLDVTEGARVTKGQKLATITDPKQIGIYIEISSTDLAVVTPGLEGELSVTGLDKKFPVHVVGISPQVDPATGTATGELAFKESADTRMPLPSGSLGKVAFKVKERVGFQVPEYALIYRENDTFLRLVESGKAKLQKVTLGPSHRGLVEILTGLKEGSQVVERASVFVADGEEVKVQSGETGRFE